MTFFEILGTLFIGPLKLAFEIIFSLAYRVTGNLGLAVIALSMIMNILLLPMYRRADAMQEEARVTDELLRDGIAHIKKAFSGDERMMILQTYYRQNNYSPLSALKGSLSLILEIPFFMAAYQVLSTMAIMQGSAFGPIADLGAPDALLHLGDTTVNLLPIAMTVVNLVSCLLYLKGHPLRTKIQLYAMALFFLFFLYDSPACLVFYWTLNNVFSLVKTIFYKLKNPRRVLGRLCAAAGVALLVFAIFLYNAVSLKRKLFVLAVGLVLLLPWLGERLLPRLPRRQAGLARPDRKLFLLGALFITALTGLLIPGTFLAASPQEFVDAMHFYHPLWYMASACALAAGTFLVWCGVFYYLSAPGAKVIFERLMWILSGTMLVNYMFFGTDLGIISASLQYNDGLSFSGTELGTNLAVMAVLAVVLYLVVVRYRKFAEMVLLTAALTMVGMSGLHMFTVQQSVQNIQIRDSADQPTESVFRLSKTGQNVVVLMLDRAVGEYIPYLFAEKPELQQQFSGFTYYSNVLAFGESTKLGVPALLGGYEYTPVEMNRRDDMLLKDKHNESIMVMPLLFQQEGYEVTVCDPVHPNYQWLPDTSFFDAYPGINAYITEGIFQDNSGEGNRQRLRNFFCFSLMKSLPLAIQDTIYVDGTYNQLSQNTATVQTMRGLTRAAGSNSSFQYSFPTLMKLTELTEVTQEDVNTFLFLQNGATHDPQLLQMPDYTMADEVDNSPYFAQHEGGITVDGRTLKMDSPAHLTHYHTNMASLMQLGNWFDELRRQGVYDNTRIIVVSDHSYALQQLKELSFKGLLMERFFPLLLVKDFGSQEYTVSDAFMTNADVPSLAAEGLVENPTNPFTGKPISMAEKTAHDQFVMLAQDADLNSNNGNTFVESKWVSVKDNIWDSANWTVYEDMTVLKEHAAP